MYLKSSSCALTQTISGQQTNDLDHRFSWLVFSKECVGNPSDAATALALGSHGKMKLLCLLAWLASNNI
jgi:hypothetical protein